AFGFTGRKANQFKIEYIKAFNLMNESLKNQTVSVIETPEDKLALTMTVANRTVKRVATIEKDIDELKNKVVIDSGSYGAIGRNVNHKVYRYLDEHKYAKNNKNTSLMFKDINTGIKQIANVRTRSQIKNKDFEKVMQYIDAWEPATATKMELINKKVEV
ncbi:MAG: ORF6C domain-containing protein, partial [Apilactobacillus sp.]|nr:ORF6C domain-containing protein [Apilactobacillus sp.]